MFPLAAMLLFLGTNTAPDSGSRGLYAVRLDETTGALSAAELAAETPFPGFLALHPTLPRLYALHDQKTGTEPLGSGVAAFALEAGSAQLSSLNREVAATASTTHLAVDATGRMVVAVSYSGGYVAAFPLRTNGTLGPRTALINHTGQLGPARARQDKPHPHSVTLSPDNRHAYVCDLGLDAVVVYALDPATASLRETSLASTVPGAGPRHSKVSADGRFVYVVNELNGSVTVFARDAATGELTSVQNISTLPDGFKGENLCAEIRLSPDGRFVYASNRGHDSLAVFAHDAERGTLSAVEIVPCGGGHPRNFALSPDGAWLVCANRDSDNLVSFRVDRGTGRLTATGHTTRVPKPICVLFAP
jgi:6-phosphogluconolactonase